MWPLFLGFRPFNWYILVNSINERVWSPKTKATQTFMNVVIWRKKYIYSTTTTQKDDLKLGPSHHRSFHALFHFNEKSRGSCPFISSFQTKMYPDSYLKGTFKISFLQSSKKVIFMPMFFKKNFAFLHKYKNVHSNLNIVNKFVRPFLFTISNNSLYQM